MKDSWVGCGVEKERGGSRERRRGIEDIKYSSKEKVHDANQIN